MVPGRRYRQKIHLLLTWTSVTVNYSNKLTQDLTRTISERRRCLNKEGFLMISRHQIPITTAFDNATWARLAWFTQGTLLGLSREDSPVTGRDFSPPTTSGFGQTPATRAPSGGHRRCNKIFPGIPLPEEFDVPRQRTTYRSSDLMPERLRRLMVPTCSMSVCCAAPVIS